MNHTSFTHNPGLARPFPKEKDRAAGRACPKPRDLRQLVEREHSLVALPRDDPGWIHPHADAPPFRNVRRVTPIALSLLEHAWL